MIVLKSPREIARMREAGKRVAELLALLRERARPGVTTGELNAFAEAFFESHGAEPAFKGYKGYPASICTSVNEEVVHGIPGRRELASGDILSLDVGVRLKHYHGDAAATFPIGKVSDGAMRLIVATEGALAAAVERLEPDVPLVEISRAIQSHAEERGYQVVRRFVGHGIGRRLHEDPQVPNYVAPGTPPVGVRLRAGTVLAIEPMLNEGTGEVEELADGWTVVTADRSLSAHAEHTVAVKEHGAEILTALG